MDSQLAAGKAKTFLTFATFIDIDTGARHSIEIRQKYAALPTTCFTIPQLF